MSLRVSNGKYTFDILRDGQILIARYGEAWHRQREASNAITSLIYELDAARVVLDAARRLGDEAPMAIKDALAKHSNLVDDREPPSAWSAA